MILVSALGLSLLAIVVALLLLVAAAYIAVTK